MRENENPSRPPSDVPTAFFRGLGRVPDWAIVVAVLVVHVGMLAWNARRQSPTIDEPAHLVAGLSYWTTGKFDLYNVNPPLPRLVGALPVLLMQPELDALFPYVADGRGRSEFPIGSRFVVDNAPQVFVMFTAARCALITFSLLGALVCYQWARRLAGRAAGHLALALWCFFPEVLAHGSLMTNDVPAAATGVCAAFFFWRWLARRTVRNSMFAGLALGVALLTKTTWLILLVLWPLLWLVVLLVQRRSDEGRRWVQQLGQLAMSLTVGLAVVNAGYLFQGSFQRLGDYSFLSETLIGAPNPHPQVRDETRPDNRFRGTWLGVLPVPLPGPMVIGVDVQKSDFEHYRPAYLFGRHYGELPWYFYLCAALVKWPLGFWLLIWFRGIARVPGRSVVDWLPLLAPPVAVFALASATATPGYFRYVLPAAPFLFVWCAQIADVRCAPSWRQRLPVLVACGWLIGSSVWVFPHSLSYFNEFAGGPQNGHVHLNDCNIEWGEDLFELKSWVERHPQARPLYVLYHGQVSPRLVGIDARLPFEEARGAGGSSPPPLRPGFYAISVHTLHGGLTHMSDPQGLGSHDAFPECQPFRTMEPVARAGSSIYIYHVR